MIKAYSFVCILLLKCVFYSDIYSQTSYTIMPLGNSITFDHTANDLRPAGDRISYRYCLYVLLNHAGYSFDFVGSESAGSNYFPDIENAGFPGIKSNQLIELLQNGYNPVTDDQETPGPYLDGFLPDFILLHIGTNSVKESAADIESILNEINDYKSRTGKDTKIIVARIINRQTYNLTTTIFNNNIAELVNTRNDPDVFLADMENGAGINYITDMIDDLHPNTTGYKKMAIKWFEVLTEILPQKTYLPKIIITPIDTGTVNKEYNSRIYAIGNPAPSFTLTDSPAGMSINSETGMISWTPESSGIFPVSARVSNTYGSVTESYNLIISGPVGLPDDPEFKKSYKLDVYPTFVKKGFHINLYVPEESEISISIYNILGMKLMDIVNREFEVGEHHLYVEELPDKSINATEILLLRMIHKNGIIVRKILFVP